MTTRFISSTATTASYSRRAGEDPEFGRAAAAVVMVASTVVFVRVLVEFGAVAPDLVAEIAPPLCALAAVDAGLVGIGLARMGSRIRRIPGQDDPTELRAALAFGVLYGAILFAVAAAKERFGKAGLYTVAGVSGLTDVDAITLSVATLAEAGRIDSATAWRAILLAVQSNVVFKGGLDLALGGAAMARPVAVLFCPSLLAGLGILALWI